MEPINVETATRAQIYKFYVYDIFCSMKKEDLDKIPLETIKKSIMSNGLSPEAVCLMGTHPGCGCNTCRRK